MHIQKPLRITKGNNSNRIGLLVLFSFIMNIYQINMNEFDEIHSMTLHDIKEICTYKKAIKS